MDDASGIVALQGEGTLIEFPGKILARLRACGFVVFEDAFSINQDSHAVALDDNLLGPPLVILCRGLGNVYQAVQAGSLDPITMSIVHLALETRFGPAFGLVLGMEINAAVRMGAGHHVHFEVEILERLFIADVEEMATRPVS